MIQWRHPFRVAAGILLAATVAEMLTASQPAKPKSQKATLAELWRDPGNIAAKDLRWGRGGKSLVPSAEAEYQFKATDTTGYSPGYDVVDPKGRKWDVKTGDEGQPEVMASRLLWAVGYHQPIVYFVPEWKMTAVRSRARCRAGFVSPPITTPTVNGRGPRTRFSARAS